MNTQESLCITVAAFGMTVKSLSHMFEWMNASVTIADKNDIQGGDLVNFDLLCMPGGWAGDIFEGLGITGILKW